jgi:hypothetical protein
MVEFTYSTREVENGNDDVGGGDGRRYRNASDSLTHRKVATMGLEVVVTIPTPISKSQQLASISYYDRDNRSGPRHRILGGRFREPSAVSLYVAKKMEHHRFLTVTDLVDVQ